jgi:hypothetical protein
MSAENGEDKLWEVLHGRFPEKESTDLLGGSLRWRIYERMEPGSKMLVIGAADELELIFQPKRGDGSPCTAAGCRKNRKPYSQSEVSGEAGV